jgi:hypothetical protein
LKSITELKDLEESKTIFVALLAQYAHVTYLDINCQTINVAKVSAT